MTLASVARDGTGAPDTTGHFLRAGSLAAEVQGGWPHYGRSRKQIMRAVAFITLGAA